MIITEELRNKILLHLPKDYQKQGAEFLGCSRSLINKVMHDGHENDDIAQWLITTARSLKIRKENTEKELTSIARQL